MQSSPTSLDLQLQISIHNRNSGTVGRAVKMPKLSLAKLERHLYSAADRLRQEGLDAATYKDYIFGMLFLKRCSDVFDAEREKIVGSKVEARHGEGRGRGAYGENPDYYDGFFVPERARWAYLQRQVRRRNRALRQRPRQGTWRR